MPKKEMFKSLKDKKNKLKETSRGKAVLKLIRWGIFFVGLFIFCLIASFIKPPVTDIEKTPEENNNPNNNQVESNISPKEAVVKILNSQNISTFNYNYEISVNNQKVNYEGIKSLTNESGYKTVNDAIIKYFVDESGTYQDTAGGRILITNLYENIDLNYLNLSNLANILSNLELTQDLTCDCIYPVFIASDALNNYQISLSNYLSEEDVYISSVIISGIDYTYNLKFSNVGGG